MRDREQASLSDKQGQNGQSERLAQSSFAPLIQFNEVCKLLFTLSASTQEHLLIVIRLQNYEQLHVAAVQSIPGIQIVTQITFASSALQSLYLSRDYDLKHTCHLLQAAGPVPP